MMILFVCLLQNMGFSLCIRILKMSPGSSAWVHRHTWRQIVLCFQVLTVTCHFFVRMSDNARAEVWSHGNIELQLKVGESLKTCVLKNGMFVTSLHFFMILVGTICKNRFRVVLGESKRHKWLMQKCRNRLRSWLFVRPPHGDTGNSTQY